MATGNEETRGFPQEGLLVRQALKRVVTERRFEGGVRERQRPVQVRSHRSYVRVHGEVRFERLHLPLDTHELHIRANPLAHGPQRQPTSTAKIDDRTSTVGWKCLRQSSMPIRAHQDGRPAYPQASSAADPRTAAACSGRAPEPDKIVEDRL